VYDIVIINGRVFDGTGSPWQWADVGIKDGKVASIVPACPGEKSSLLQKAPVVIDAKGQVVTPGFIDMHTHSDLPLVINGTADSKIMQGVTTEVIGQCGNSPAPITDEALPSIKSSAKGMPIEWNWRSYGEFLDVLAQNGTSVNVVGMVGHGTIRMVTMGFAERPPTAEELEDMKRLARESVEQGAFGMSTGLIYTPGSYSETPEVVAISEVVREAGGLYFTHLRAEGEKVLTAIDEALEIGKKAKIPVQISHLKAFGLARGNGEKIIAKLNKAREDGIDVTADQYPYIASSTGLSAFLPPWAHEGGREKIVERLKDRATRKRIYDDMQRALPDWPNDFRLPWQDVQIASCAEQKFIGKRIQEIADSHGKDAYEMAFDILAEIDPATSVVIFGMDEDDVSHIMKSDLVVVGSDGSCLNPVGPLGKGQPHPRNYGTAARVLAHYVRDKKILTLPEAIRKMTAQSASRLGLKDRGQLREGFAADIVVFDPAAVKDNATFEKPHQFASGVNYVIVNGEVVVKEGKHTMARPGKILHR